MQFLVRPVLGRYEIMRSQDGSLKVMSFGGVVTKVQEASFGFRYKGTRSNISLMCNPSERILIYRFGYSST